MHSGTHKKDSASIRHIHLVHIVVDVDDVAGQHHESVPHVPGRLVQPQPRVLRALSQHHLQEDQFLASGSSIEVSRLVILFSIRPLKKIQEKHKLQKRLKSVIVLRYRMYTLHSRGCTAIFRPIKEECLLNLIRKVKF